MSTDEIEQYFEKLTAFFDCWLALHKSLQASWEADDYYNKLCEVYKIIYEIDDIEKLTVASLFRIL